MCGLMAFSRFLSWLLSAYHQITVAALIGFLVWSLSVTWPWKLPVSTMLDRHGELIVLESINVLPAKFSMATGQAADVMWVILFALLGVFLVLTTEYAAKKFGK